MPRYVLLHNRDRCCPFCGASRLMVTRGTATRQTYTADTQFSCCGCGNVFDIDELDCTSLEPSRQQPPPRRRQQPKPPTRYLVQCGCGAEFQAVVSTRVAAACPWCDLRWSVTPTGRLHCFKPGRDNERQRCTG